MKYRGCPYRAGLRGRSIKSRPGVGSPTTVARLACSKCPTVGEKPVRADATPHQIDGKFAHSGWQVDPHLCPDCQKKDKAVASKPTPAAMKAQAQMFALLSEHFDTVAGTFAAGWSDAGIAKATGLSPDLVTEFRIAAFGEMKEPAELRQLRDDITALDQLAREQAGTISTEVSALRSRLAEISKRWAA